MELLEGRFDEFFENVQRPDLIKCSARAFGNNVFYKGLLISALLLAGKHEKNNPLSLPSFKFMESEVAELFSVKHVSDLFDPDVFAKLKIYVPISSETLISLWLENTRLSDEDALQLLSIFSSEVTEMIDTLIGANRSSLFAKVADWIKILTEIYIYYGDEKRLAELQNRIQVKYSGKKAFIKILKNKDLNPALPLR